MNNFSLSNKNNSIVFGAKICLCDKSVMGLPHKTELLKKASPMDFFYKESKCAEKLDLVFRSMKGRIRKEQCRVGNSELKKSILKVLFQITNKMFFSLNRLMYVRDMKSVFQTIKFFEEIEKDSDEYIDAWAILGNSINDKFVNVNIEDKKFEELGDSKASKIFIMNHDNPSRDKFIYPIVNSFLNYSYAAQDKQKTCPRPYIIVSKNVLKGAVNRNMRGIYEKMGLVSIDASMSGRKFSENVAPMRNLIKNFSEDKANIFVFPEGNNSVFKNKTLAEKFQLSFAKIFRQIFVNKSEIEIVPIGISYNEEKGSLGNIFIGDTIKLNNESGVCIFETSNFSEVVGDVKKNDTLKNITQNLIKSLEYCVQASKNLTE